LDGWTNPHSGNNSKSDIRKWTETTTSVQLDLDFRGV
jgi:hypothetical protein